MFFAVSAGNLQLAASHPRRNPGFWGAPARKKTAKRVMFFAVSAIFISDRLTLRTEPSAVTGPLLGRRGDRRC